MTVDSPVLLKPMLVGATTVPEGAGRKAGFSIGVQLFDETGKDTTKAFALEHHLPFSEKHQAVKLPVAGSAKELSQALVHLGIQDTLSKRLDFGPSKEQGPQR